MDSKERAEIIRKGNQAFNEGDYPKAKELYLRAGYKDGLIRLGDYYMFERRLPLLAYGYYKKAGATRKIEDLQRRMVSAMGKWLGEDKLKEESRQKVAPPAQVSLKPDQDGLISVPVNPLLKETALKILQGK